MKKIVPLIFSMAILACSKDVKKEVNGEVIADTVLHFNTGAGGMDISLAGGAIFNMYLSADSLNPFTWFLKKEQMPVNNQAGAGTPFRGHFLCLGRWGSPTPGERAAGIPHNGEQTREIWTLEEHEKAENGFSRAFMSCDLPLDHMKVWREVQTVDNDEDLIIGISESVQNTGTIGRLNNVVQHITLGAPFLNRNTVVNANATYGFNQMDSINLLEKMSSRWPAVKHKGAELDIQSTNQDSSYCASFIFDTLAGPYGWVSAYRPENGLILAYIWRLSDYPWLNVWHQMIDGKPWAKGLEFGTGGMGRDYRELLNNNSKFFGYNSFEWIDAGETVSKKYVALMLKTDENILGISNIAPQENDLIISFKNGSRREVKSGALLLNP